MSDNLKHYDCSIATIHFHNNYENEYSSITSTDKAEGGMHYTDVLSLWHVRTRTYTYDCVAQCSI